MADHTKIEWTDATWSPVTGCTKVSEGCRNCYIERTPPFRMAGRGFACPRCSGTGYVEDADGNRFSPDKSGRMVLGVRCASCDGSGRRGVGDTTGVRLHEDRLDWPLRKRSWRGKRVFVCSMADLFHDAVPSSFIADVFAVMSLTPEVTYQVLTKRPVRMRSLLNSAAFCRDVRSVLHDAHGIPEVESFGTELFPLRNVWLGVSVEDQKAAYLRIPALLETPAAVRFLSCEPLLGPVDLGMRVVCPDGIDWVIVGGESGPKARPMHPDWARSLRDQCATAGVPYLFKQWGEWAPDEWIEDDGHRHVGRKLSAKDPKSLVMHPGGMTALTPDNPFDPWDRGHPNWGTVMRRVGKKAAGRLLDGRTHDEFPGGAS